MADLALRGVITIDGPGGAGKSTVARELAKRLGVDYLDTGALYRATALWLKGQGIGPQEDSSLAQKLETLPLYLRQGRVWLGEEDVTEAVRSAEAGMLASQYSALPSVREALLDVQRNQALRGPLVADGRDMGTVVFPLAPLKIFLTADSRVRALRRAGELEALGQSVDLSEIERQIKERDEADSSRALAPLRPAEDAVFVDSSQKTVDEVVGDILQALKETTHGA